MKKHTAYPKIHQLRNVIENVTHEVQYVGSDEEGKAIYDLSAPKPTLTFKGTVKLHGTNSSICLNATDGFWVQSRQNIITVENDNADFAAFAEKNKSVFLYLINEVTRKHKIDSEQFTVSIFGEWAGKGIQKGVGICDVERAFYIFGAKVSNPNDDQFNSYWVSSADLRSSEHRIFNVEDFETFLVDVDLEKPESSQDRFSEILEMVEKQCPIAKAMGVKKGTGEGVVWTTEFKGKTHRFKLKGEKHSVTKRKKKVTVDVEKIRSIEEFVAYAVTENRFEQAMENVFGKERPTLSKMGEMIKWVVQDIAAEESDTLLKNDLTPKDVNRYISAKTKDMFIVAQAKG